MNRNGKPLLGDVVFPEEPADPPVPPPPPDLGWVALGFLVLAAVWAAPYLYRRMTHAVTPAGRSRGRQAV